MKIKGLVSLFICLIFVLCTACGNRSKPAETENSSTAPTVTESAANSSAEPQAIYEAYLNERIKLFTGYENESAGQLKEPPQIYLANACYAYYDVDKDGQDELIQTDRKYIYEIYTVRNGEVAKIEIRQFMSDGYTFSLTLMEDGSLCSDAGFGHVPGYQRLHLVDGEYRMSDFLTPPSDHQIFPQDNYEYMHEVITKEEFDRRIAELKKKEAPVKLEPFSLLNFAQTRGISLDWLDKPRNKQLSFEKPGDPPLPRQNYAREEQEIILKEELEEYQRYIEAPNKPDAYYDLKTPAKRYYALYDIDGNGDDEVFFGEESKNGKIRITEYYYWIDENNYYSNRRSSVSVALYDYDWLQDTRVLSNGWVVQEYVITEGDVENSYLKYNGIGVSGVSLWRYGDEAALYDYSDPDIWGHKPLSITPEAYDRYRADLEDGAETVELNWIPLESYGQ